MITQRTSLLIAQWALLSLATISGLNIGIGGLVKTYAETKFFGLIILGAGLIGEGLTLLGFAALLL
jgi:hypothetical protein